MSYAIRRVAVLRMAVMGTVVALVVAQLVLGLTGSIRGALGEKPSPPKPPSNLIEPENGGTAGWTPANATLARDGAVSFGGEQALKVTAAGGPGFSASTLASVTGDTTGLRFRLSAEIYVPPGSNLLGKKVAVQLEERGGSQSPSSTDAAETTLRPGWQHLSGLAVIVPPDRDQVGLQVGVADGAAAGDSFDLADATLARAGRIDVSIPPQPRGNLIGQANQNGTTLGWAADGSRLARDRSVTLGAGQALRVTDVGGAQFSAVYTAPIQGTFTGQRFALSARVYVPAGSHLIGTRAALRFGELGGISSDVFTDVAPTALRAGWQRLAGIASVVHGGRAAVSFQPVVLDGAAAGDTFYVADVDLARAPSDSGH